MAKEVIISKYFWLGVFVLIADQVTKNIATEAGMVIINQGGALGLNIQGFNLGIFTWNHFLLATSIVILVGIFRSMKNWGQGERDYGYLILFAGLSNVIDRIVWGGVRDWVDLPFFAMKNNLADIFLTVTIIGLLISFYNIKRYEQRT